MEKLAILTVKDDSTDVEVKADNNEVGLLDARFLETPSFAVAQSVTATRQMAELSKKSIKMAVALLGKFDLKKFKEVILLENQIDKYEDELGTYLVKISSKHPSLYR